MGGMEISDGLEYVRQRQQGVLVTLKRDGRPQLSNIVYRVTDDGTIQISVTADRAKTNNLQRDGRASLHVTADDFRSYCVIDGDAEVMPPAASPDDATADAMVDYYRALQGEHPDWSEYRQAMVDDRRLLVTITPTHAYGMLGR
ncbi:PPOX class probable F420-dependent enzyme [Ilumatobacter fluminis]|uniref:PPOX class probable F420-dependent enzyme n=2 Tax=Ilumatobacter fluminis TaxID=467091 RepID=A0A4V3EIK1_9ACTN|nr:PPOX class probable F420-dependent enzyme [Ilumatobacter fluminis]